MTVEIDSITIKAMITPDDPAQRPKPFERTFTREELPKSPGWIGDIFSFAKRYLFHNAPTDTLPSTEGRRRGV